MTDGNTEGGDPFENAFGGNKVPRGDFVTTFDRSAGEMMVYGGTFFGLFLLLGAFMTGELGMWIVSLSFLGVAFYFFPMVRTDKAQMRVEPRGLFLDGLGWVPWTAVRDVKIVNRSVRTIRNAQLDIALRAPLREVVMEADEKPDILRGLMMRIWSTDTTADGIRHGLLRVKLEALRAKPEEILAAINRHI